MFSNLFGSIGAALFGEISVGGISLGKIGRALGHSFGDAFDDTNKQNHQSLLQPIDLDRVTVTSDNPNDTIPFIYGTVRVGGKIIWTSPIQTKINKSHLFTGKWGILPTKTPDKYVYSMSFAVALCEGEIDRVNNIYLNDRLISSDIITRVYTGTHTQTIDPLIQSFEGNTAKSFRHTAYVVIEDIPIDLYNKNLPNFTFDVVRGSNPKIEDSIKSVCLIPASGEFVYATDLVQRDAEFSPIYENVHTPSYESDFAICVKNLKNAYKNLKHISMVVGWFFDHTDPAILNVLPAVETRNKNTTPLIWSVAGYNRQTAWLVSHNNNIPAYGGTPSDEAVRQGIIKLYQAGYKVTFYPFLFGDIVPNNPQNQPAYPWRGRITPTGSNTQKANAINRFFDSNNNNGAGYNAMIIHYANLCKQINDIYPNAIDLFIIGSELKGLTQTKIGNQYPAVEKLCNLATQVRNILGTSVKITYAADWSEGGSFTAPDNSLDFPLDDLWSDTNIDYIAYDWYAPLTDWRDGDNHLDTQLADNDKDLIYLQSCIEGGEGYDWYYANDNHRDNQIRTPITDGAYNEPFVYRIKDIRNRWLHYHYPRDSNGIRLTTPTSWIPQSKKIIFTELGCPAVNKGGNSPNLFPDPKSSENALPHYSNGQQDDFIQRAVLKAYLDYWETETTMIDTERTAIWCVDARPYPVFPARSDIWGDSGLFQTGHWIDGRGGFTTLQDIITDITQRAGLHVTFQDFTNITIQGFVINRQMSAENMLTDLMKLFQIRLTNHNNIDIVTNGEKGVFALNENNIVRFIDNGTGDILGDATNSNIDNNHYQSIINRVIHHQFSGYQSGNSVGLLKNNSFVTQSHDDNLPTKIQAYFLDVQSAGEKNFLEVSALVNNHQNNVKMVLSLSGFSHDIKPYLETYLYALRASMVTTKLLVYQQHIKAGDIVTYDGKKYYVHAIEYNNYLMRLSLVLFSGYKKPVFYKNNDFIKPQSDYALASPIIKYVTIGINQYIGLSVKPYYKNYYLYRTPVNGSVTEYVSEIIPTMIYGYTATDFYNRPTNIIDTEHDLWIILPNGESLGSLTSADIAQGHNRLAIYNANSDLWELISFETAILVDNTINKYQLSKISRGLLSTDNAMGSPVSAGANIVMMNNSLIKINNDFIYTIK